jgi:hypothetical protein
VTAFLSGAGWCAVYLGTLFGLMASAAGAYENAIAYLCAGLVGWVAVRRVGA